MTENELKRARQTISQFCLLGVLVLIVLGAMSGGFFGAFMGFVVGFITMCVIGTVLNY